MSNNQIARAIYLATKEKNGMGQKEILKNAVQFLARRRLLSRVPQILSSLRKIVDNEEGRARASVISAKKLREHDKTTLSRLLKKRYLATEVVFEESLDPSLFAGVRVQVNDEVIDLTLRNKITQLQKYLIKTV